MMNKRSTPVAPPAVAAGGIGSLRKATNITLPTDLVAECRALGVNLSQVCEASLRARVQQERERRWRTDHAAFLSAHNAQIEQDGLPLAVFQAF